MPSHPPRNPPHGQPCLILFSYLAEYRVINLGNGGRWRSRKKIGSFLPATTFSKMVSRVSDVPSSENLPWMVYPDIGNLARWWASSWKYGFGLDCLRDDSPETFWHSEGKQPHLITLEFPKRVAIQKVIICLDQKRDDVCTPEVIAIRAGTSLLDLQEIRRVLFDKPVGWVALDVTNDPNEDGNSNKPLYAYVIQLVIMANYDMNGDEIDTHIRGLKIVGPLGEPTQDDTEAFPFVSPEFKMYEAIR